MSTRHNEHSPGTAIQNINAMRTPHRALFIPEILEQILVCLPFEDIVAVRRVSQNFNQTILASPSLRNSLWLPPLGLATKAYPCKLNPFLVKLFHNVGRFYNDKLEAMLCCRDWHKTLKGKSIPKLFKQMPLARIPNDFKILVGTSARCCMFLDPPFTGQPEPRCWKEFTNPTLYDFLKYIQGHLPRRHLHRLWRWGGKDVQMSSDKDHNDVLHCGHLNGNGNTPALVVRIKLIGNDNDRS